MTPLPDFAKPGAAVWWHSADRQELRRVLAVNSRSVFLLHVPTLDVLRVDLAAFSMYARAIDPAKTRALSPRQASAVIRRKMREADANATRYQKVAIVDGLKGWAQ